MECDDCASAFISFISLKLFIILYISISLDLNDEKTSYLVLCVVSFDNGIFLQLFSYLFCSFCINGFSLFYYLFFFLLNYVVRLLFFTLFKLVLSTIFPDSALERSLV
ncbi:hypothetical protein T4B_5646 [Trichinella pseudospiralis]|uniref:Uncharacterized protein n=1 Tax=Trichinella pseudospiralis TaxID=6337 RepID=A0A0V1H0L9_TRIPS|nr:hypothetical protein T4B_5646 [Trichinella pseudospiralis]KRZ39767.1 hypothetical protein T4C_13274 [Trichinella pseudospiralis]